MRNVRESVTGVVIVIAIAVGVWWVRIPGLTSFVLVPPLFLGVGVGVVARYSSRAAGPARGDRGGNDADPVRHLRRALVLVRSPR